MESGSAGTKRPCNPFDYLNEGSSDVGLSTGDHTDSPDSSSSVPASSSAADLTVPLSHSGGYWFGGYDTENGRPEAIFPCRPWGACLDVATCTKLVGSNSRLSRKHVRTGFGQLVTGMFDMNPMERWHRSVAFVAGDAKSNSTANDWSLVLLQAGLLTLAARAVRFDEFHSYAWARLGFPNETARLVFAERVVRPLVEHALRRNPKSTDKGDSSQRESEEEDAALSWQKLRSAQFALSDALLRADFQSPNQDSNGLVATLVQKIKTFSRTLAIEAFRYEF